LKLLHISKYCSKLLQISISEMPVVEISDTIVPISNTTC